MSATRTALRLAGGALCATLLACASGPGSPQAPAVSPIPNVEISPDERAAQAFIRGRMLELEGRLPEAAEAYLEAGRHDPESAELERYLAQVYAHMGQADEAVRHGRRALELEPEDEVTVFALARLYGALDRNEEALALLEPLYREGRLESRGLFGIFNLYVELDRLSEAEGVARSMIETEPENPRAHFVAGAILERMERPAEAEEAYRRALAIDRADPRVFDALARLRRRAGDRDGEVAVIREKLETFSSNVPGLLRLAQIYQEMDDRAAAIEVLRGMLEQHPEQLSGRFQLGFLLYREGSVLDAIDQFLHVAESSSALGDLRFRSEVHYFLGRAYHDAEMKAEALEVLEGLPTDADRFVDARVLMARIHEGEGDFDAAVVEARRAAVATDSVPVQVYLAGLMQRSGDLDGAVALMQNLIEASPDDPELHYDLGLIYSGADQEDKAVELMLRVLEENPDHPSALNYVGYTWADRGTRLDEALAMILHAVELRPDDGFITDSLGWVHYQQGLQWLEQGDSGQARASFVLAIEKLEHALELLDEGDPIITRHLGDAYRSVARFDDAIDSYRRALLLDPEEEDAAVIRRQIELLELQVGGPPGARR